MTRLQDSFNLTHTKQRGAKKFLYDLDILRAVAIILIVCSHIHSFIYIRQYQSMLETVSSYIALVGLSIFFFVSGFSLYYNHKIIPNVNEFYKKRLLRIYPLYFISLLPVMASTNNLTLAISLIGLQGIFFKDNDGILMWFVGVIFLYYLIYPLLITGNIWIKTTIILIMFLCVRLIFDLIHINFFIYYGAFVAGIIICKNNRVYPVHAIAGIIGLLGIYFGSRVVEIIPPIPYCPNFLVVTIIPLICSYLAFKYADLFDIAHKLISGIAFGSYPVFLFHFMFISLLGLKAIPFIFIAGYYIQKLELLIKKKVIGVPSS